MKIRRLARAITMKETATPVRTSLSAEVARAKLASASTSSVAASAPMKAKTGTVAKPEKHPRMQERENRPESPAGRDPQKMGIGQRVARHGLQNGAHEREPRPHQGRKQGAWQPDIPDDGGAPGGPVGCDQARGDAARG